MRGIPIGKIPLFYHIMIAQQMSESILPMQIHLKILTVFLPIFYNIIFVGKTPPQIRKNRKSPHRMLLFTGGKIEHDYRGLLRVPHPALHSDGIVSADPEHSDPDMTGLGLSKTSFTDR